MQPNAHRRPRPARRPPLPFPCIYAIQRVTEDLLSDLNIDAQSEDGPPSLPCGATTQSHRYRNIFRQFCCDISGLSHEQNDAPPKRAEHENGWHLMPGIQRRRSDGLRPSGTFIANSVAVIFPRQRTQSAQNIFAPN